MSSAVYVLDHSASTLPSRYLSPQRDHGCTDANYEHRPGFVQSERFCRFRKNPALVGHIGDNDELCREKDGEGQKQLDDRRDCIVIKGHIELCFVVAVSQGTWVLHLSWDRKASGR
jgi:hypothetical protein